MSGGVSVVSSMSVAVAVVVMLFDGGMPCGTH